MAETYFAVFRERGSAWDASRPMRQQPRWDEHAAFMDALVDSGVIVLGGPLGEGDFRSLPIFKAERQRRSRPALPQIRGYSCACSVSPRLSGGRFCSAPRPSVNPDECHTLGVTVQNPWK